eukprot:GEMP01068498.1.p1 GENE.GEMP01068498.1~~GEMP01068498.1.p1  ORF type:complete len:227 (+),score=31.30 GEMP01068498.1:18-698(+)
MRTACGWVDSSSIKEFRDIYRRKMNLMQPPHRQRTLSIRRAGRPHHAKGPAGTAIRLPAPPCERVHGARLATWSTPLDINFRTANGFVDSSFRELEDGAQRKNQKDQNDFCAPKHGQGNMRQRPAHPDTGFRPNMTRRTAAQGSSTHRFDQSPPSTNISRFSRDARAIRGLALSGPQIMASEKTSSGFRANFSKDSLRRPAPNPVTIGKIGQRMSGGPPSTLSGVT